MKVEPIFLIAYLLVYPIGSKYGLMDWSFSGKLSVFEYIQSEGSISNWEMLMIMPQMLAEGPCTDMDIMDKIVSDVKELSMPQR